MSGSRGVAILVGAGDAIGAAVARRFAKGGYTVCICRREAAKSQNLVDELKAEGHQIHAISVDARQEKESKRRSGRSRSACSMPAPTSTSP
jgi:NAD(P)-dependent dehydrogenase (short-subunit alcohol dehydrogenase family)